MKKTLFLSMCLALFTTKSFAISLPSLSAGQETSPHKFFLSSQTSSNEFDSWKIDSGYAYSLFDSIDLYIGTRMNNTSDTYNQNGFLSGISYNFNDKVSLKSTVHASKNVLDDNEVNTVSAEVTSSVKINKHLELHATVDYKQWQQGIEVGLGFRF